MKKDVPPSNDCNLVTETGTYLLSADTSNKPSGWTQTRSVLLVFNPSSDAYTVQAVFEYSTGKFATRVGVTQPWVIR